MITITFARVTGKNKIYSSDNSLYVFSNIWICIFVNASDNFQYCIIQFLRNNENTGSKYIQFVDSTRIEGKRSLWISKSDYFLFHAVTLSVFVYTFYD